MLGDEAPAYSGRLAKLVGVATTANVPGNCVAAFRSRSSSVVRAAKSGNLSSRCTMPLLGLLGAFAGDLLATSLSDPARRTSHGRVLDDLRSHTVLPAVVTFACFFCVVDVASFQPHLTSHLHSLPNRVHGWLQVSDGVDTLLQATHAAFWMALITFDLDRVRILLATLLCLTVILCDLGTSSIQLATFAIAVPIGR